MGNMTPPELAAECRESEFGEIEALENPPLKKEKSREGEELEQNNLFLRCDSDFVDHEGLAYPPCTAPSLLTLCDSRLSQRFHRQFSFEQYQSSNGYQLNGGEEEKVLASEEDTGRKPPTTLCGKFKQGYKDLVSAIIRPPRLLYDPKTELGPSKFIFRHRPFKRTDFELLNAKKQSLKCSHWEPDGWKLQTSLPCIIYLHGNSSARIEAINQLSIALRLGCTMCSFDFAGSGLSDGEYVSLGYYEKDDLAVVVEYLQNVRNVGPIALWGRSMGAATALMYMDQNPSIAALVLDSTFTDFNAVSKHFAESIREAGMRAPNILVKLVLRMIRSSVYRTAGFNIKDIQPIAYASTSFSPALFIAAEDDNVIPPDHSRQVYDLYAGDKNFLLVDGDHNAQRPPFLYHTIFIFLQNALHLTDSMVLDAQLPNDYSSRPPWMFPHSMTHIYGMDVTEPSSAKERGQEEIEGGIIGVLGTKCELVKEANNLDVEHETIPEIGTRGRV